jgi:hypothetical protein
MSTTAEPTEGGYVLNGTKLWATNGSIADVVVIMAVVPKGEGRKGGITAFICPTDLDGVTVTHRNEFMGLRGIENSRTTFEDVFVPEENVIGGEGKGLKIALSTLNTGRLSLPAICTATTKYALKIAREWSCERKQWGRPVGEHDPVAQKLAFIAGSAFGLEAVVDVSSRLADDKRNDIRIEAALAKLYASELGWQAVDELVQIRGGRGYETADSLQRRGEKPIPVEQLMRDMRINRIFEGSTEIMHLLIAREAVDAHLKAAGALADDEATLEDQVRAAVDASGFYAKWLPQLVAGRGTAPMSYAEFGPLAEHLRFVERSSRKLARQTFYGMSRWRAKLQYRQGFLGRVVDIGAELFAIAAACSRAEMLRADDEERGRSAYQLADTFCDQSRLRVEALFAALWTNTDDADRRLASGVLAGDYTWLEEGVLDPSEGTGPWIAEWSAGASTEDSVWRAVR